MTLVTFGSSGGVPSGVINLGSGWADFDVGAAYEAGGGTITVNTVTDPRLYAALLSFDGLEPVASDPGSQSFQLAMTQAWIRGSYTAGDYLVANADGSFSGTSNGGGGSGGAVSSVFGRSGAIVAQTGDYTASQITGAAPLASPVFTGNVNVPTPAAGTNNDNAANTKWVTLYFAPNASPALTGTPTAPTPTAGDSSTQIATTAFVANAIGSAGGGAVSSVFGRTGVVVAASGDYTVSQIGGAAPLASPAFTGTPTAPTPSAGDSSTKLATTSFVGNAVKVSSVFGRTGAIVAASGDYSVSQITGAAPLASPALTGSPTAPTPTVGDSSTKLATTSFVGTAVNKLLGVSAVIKPSGDTTGATDHTNIAAALAANASVFLATGTFYDSTGLTLPANARLWGSGINSTVFKSDVGITLGSGATLDSMSCATMTTPVKSVNGYQNAHSYVTTQAVSAGAISLPINDTTYGNAYGLAVGDEIKIGSETPTISAINGGTLTLSAGLANAYASGTTVSFNGTNVNCTIQVGVTGSVDSCKVSHIGGDQVSIMVQYADRSTVSDCIFEGGPGGSITFNTSTNCTAEDCIVRHSGADGVAFYGGSNVRCVNVRSTYNMKSGFFGFGATGNPSYGGAYRLQFIGCEGSNSYFEEGWDINTTLANAWTQHIIIGCLATANASWGIHMVGSGNTVVGSVVDYNGASGIQIDEASWGGASYGTSGLTLSDNTVIDSNQAGNAAGSGLDFGICINTSLYYSTVTNNKVFQTGVTTHTLEQHLYKFGGRDNVITDNMLQSWINGDTASKLEVNTTSGYYDIVQYNLNNTPFTSGASGGGSSPVTSVFGRLGAVVAASGDYTVAQITGAAPLASPTFTGTVSMPTPTAGDSTTKGATTAFVVGAISSAQSSVASTQKSSAYTFALADAGTVVESTNASAATFTIPANSTVAFPVGAVIEVFQYGAGQVTIAAASGVTLRSDGGKVNTAAQYATIGLRQRAANEWVLTGDLA